MVARFARRFRVASLRGLATVGLLSVGACSVLGSSLEGFTAGGDVDAGTPEDPLADATVPNVDGPVVGKDGAVRPDSAIPDDGDLGFDGAVGPDGGCAANTTKCGASCVSTQTDNQNCGTCGTTCGALEECSAGKCGPACSKLLNQAITDPWGYSWDGLERAATTFADATATCGTLAGRLPTASELYRVSATQSATVGQTSNTNYLWSQVPDGAGSHVPLRLSDALTKTSLDTASVNYRCVCPPALPKTYTGKSCFNVTSNANGCYSLAAEGARYNMDLDDRPALGKGSAIWECAFYHGHLPTPIQYAEAIQQGIGTGSNAWLHTADEVRYDLDAIVSWSTPATWVFRYIGAKGALSWDVTTTYRPFRCVGLNYDAGVYPVAVPNEWVSPQGGGYKGETADTAAAAWAAANDTCFSRGGHLPTSTELGELIMAGLPNGSGTLLWSSDQAGFNGTQFLMSAKKWTATEPSHHYDYPGDLTWLYKTTSNPYRCIYYPIDATYQGPPAAKCAGDCFTVTMPGASGAKMWFDNFDRAPALNMTGAVDACRVLGGHVPSERDHIEAIRQGLPNGSNANIASRDAELGSQTSLLTGVSKWSGIDKAYTDQYAAYATWGFAYDVKPYRCMWTNELR